MPIIGFSLLGVGGLFIYSGYLGYSPAKIIKAILDGNLPTLVKIPIDPRKQTPKTPSSGGNQTPKNNKDYNPWDFLTQGGNL